MEKVIQPKALGAPFSKNIFLYLGFASLAIISSNNAPLTFDMPFPGILIFICCLLIHCCLNDVTSIKFGIISCLLILRLLLFVINAIVLSIDMDSILEQIIITFISIVIFEYFRNSSKDNIFIIKNVLLIFSFITSIQLIICISENFMDKNDIVAGIGNSNYAATFLLLAITVCLFTETKLYEKLLTILNIISLILTQSFGACLALLIVFVIFVVKKFDWHLLKNWIILLLFFVVLAVLISYFVATDIGAEIYKKIQIKISYLLAGDLKNFSSSRTELYEFSWNNIKRHFFIGSITNFDCNIDVNYRYQNFRTHNFILESLLLYGLVGTIINFCICFFIIKDYLHRNKRINVTPYTITIFAILLHGFIEPNLFTLHFEPFAWLILGGFMSAVKTRQENL